MRSLVPERGLVIQKLRRVIRKNLPVGFKEVMGYGMIGYVVPHRLYPAGYHCNPAEPTIYGVSVSKEFRGCLSHGIICG